MTEVAKNYVDSCVNEKFSFSEKNLQVALVLYATKDDLMVYDQKFQDAYRYYQVDALKQLCSDVDVLVAQAVQPFAVDVTRVQQDNLEATTDARRKLDAFELRLDGTESSITRLQLLPPHVKNHAKRVAELEKAWLEKWALRLTNLMSASALLRSGYITRLRIHSCLMPLQK